MILNETHGRFETGSKSQMRFRELTTPFIFVVFLIGVLLLYDKSVQKNEINQIRSLPQEKRTYKNSLTPFTKQQSIR